ncbi:MAG: cytochrome c maturation protein CcmE [Pseudomonadota bacterium]
MTRKNRRLYLIITGLVLLGSAAALVLTALSDYVTLFQSPTELLANPQYEREIQLGGLVEEASVDRLSDGVTVAFRITDLQSSVPVTYKGILPDLFREGQGVVTIGSFQNDGTFLAREVLAKHDETYMPREVADALKASGKWRPESGETPSHGGNGGYGGD